jgi:hypothetical protein
MATCDCGGGWINGYRNGERVARRKGEHSRYCAEHGDPERLAALRRAREQFESAQAVRED